MELLFNHQNTKTLHHKATIKIDSDTNGQNNWLIIDWLLQIINCLQLHLKNFRSSKMGVWVQSVTLAESWSWCPHAAPVLEILSLATLSPAHTSSHDHSPEGQGHPCRADNWVSCSNTRHQHDDRTEHFTREIVDTRNKTESSTTLTRNHWLLLFDPVFLLVFVQYNDMSDSNG